MFILKWLVMCRLLFVVVICLFFVQVQGKRIDQISFKNINNAHGLSQNGINSIFQDREGYLWFGTHYGLNRYDGFEIKNYYRGNTKNDLSGNIIQSILQDSIGNIWVATTEGVSIFNPQSEQFFNLNQYAAIDNVCRHSILSMKLIDDNIFISSAEGLWQINPLNELITDSLAQRICSDLYCKRILHNKQLSSIKIFSKDSSNTFWLIANNKVVSSKILKNRLLVIDEIQIDSLHPRQITTIYNDSIGNIWVGTATHGLYRIAESKGKYYSTKIYPKNSTNDSFKLVSSITQDNENNLWVTSKGDGVVIIPQNTTDSKEVNFIRLNEQKLSGQKIKSIFISKDKTVWLGSLGNGVYCYNRNGIEFKNHRIKDNNTSIQNIRSISKDSFGRLWFGTLYEGLYLYDYSLKKITASLLKNNSVFALEKIDNNNYLAGCSDGLFHVKLNANSIKVKHLNFKNIKSIGTVFTICSKGAKYWIGTKKNIISFRLSENYKIVAEYVYDNSTLINSKLRNTIRCLKFDKYRNCLWIGGERSGLMKAELNHNDKITGFVSISTLLKNADSISKYICDINIDNNNNCWIATRNGLAFLKSSEDNSLTTCRIFSAKDGLPANLIQSIKFDGNNNLWIGTNRGLVKFRIDSNEIITYDTNDGIQGLEFSEHSAFIDSDSTFYFGGTKGVTEFSPQSTKPNRQINRVEITDFYVNGHKLDTLNSPQVYTLKHFENDFKLYFNSFNYINPTKCKYAYRLVGYNSDWKFTSALKRYAEYSNVPPGEYIFQVKSSNEDGVWNNQISTIDIEITPSFWSTIPAFLIYTALLIILVTAVYSITKKRVQKRQQAILDEQYRKKIENINQAKLQFFINISHEIRTPLTLIVCAVEKLLTSLNPNQKQKKEIKTIDRSINNLLQLTNELLEIRKIETGYYQLLVSKNDLISFLKETLNTFEPLASKRMLKLTFESSIPILETYFDTNALQKVIHNLISNAIKYTDKEGSITLKVKLIRNNTFVEVSVIDNGIGINKEHLSKIFEPFYHSNNQITNEKGFGIGLSLTKTLIQLHKGFINASSEEGIGTKVAFAIPLNDDLYTANDKADNAVLQEASLIEIEQAEEHTENKKYNDNPILIDNDALSMPTILYVDDNEELLNNIKDYLSAEYNVITALNGKVGFELAKRHLPDVILSDIIMPEVNGFEFCTILKNNVITSHIPVILLTARGDLENHYKGIETGADYFIPKPFNIKLISLRIKQLIESRNKLKELFTSNQYTTSSEITTNKKDEQFLDKLIRYVNENMSEPNLNINFIADSLGMSRSTFFRKIKAITGTTGKEFIDSIRLKKATKLLLESDLNISEIAYDTGHANPQYFTKWFKSHYNLSPTDFIKKNKKGNSQAPIEDGE